MIHQFIKPIIIVIVITLPIWVFIRTRKRYLKKTGDWGFKHGLIGDFFYIYIACLIAVTLVPIPLSFYKTDAARGVNLTPVVNTLKDLTATFAPKERYLMESSLDNIIGNIILFMPLGLVVPVLFKKVNSIGKITLVGMASSVFIETMQFILRQFKIYRTVDIDDVILNVAGTLAGYFIYTLVVKMTANKRSLQNKALCLF